MTKNIAIVGVGGQGTLLTSRIIGSVVQQAGYQVKFSEVHGMAQRGGSVTTFVRYGKQVHEPIVEPGQADILIAFESLEALRYAHFLKPGGLLVANSQRIDPMPVLLGMAEYPENIFQELSKTHRVIAYNLLEQAKKLGEHRVVNVIILGIVAKNSTDEKITLAMWQKALEETVPPKALELNKQAFELGYNL